MKKSGTRPLGSRSAPAASAEAVIAPQRHEIAVEVGAEGLHLAPEAASQLERQLLVDRLGLAVDQTATGRVENARANPAGGERLHRAAHGLGDRAATRSHRPDHPSQ